MLRSTEEGEYPNVAPYPSASDETQPLLSQQRATRVSKNIGQKLKATCAKIGEYVNPPMLGGGVAIILGMIPFMRHALFEDTGYLSPLADSIKNLGKLYTVLQMFVLGAHLYSKQGGRPAFWPMFYLFMIRFVVMTVLGCSAVYGIRHLLGDVVKEDPMLVRSRALPNSSSRVNGAYTLRTVSTGLYSDSDSDRPPCFDACSCKLCPLHHRA